MSAQKSTTLTTPLARFTRAIEAWRALLGDEHVVLDPRALEEATQTTFATTRQVSCIVRPGSFSEVQSVLRVAHAQEIAIYPVSKGRNWGLGSRVPTADNCVLLELARLDRIVEFDERLGYVTIEPGVSFEQLAAFLQAQNSTRYLSVIGGPPDASVLANTIERGEGLGPLGQRFQHACGLEVVLANGDRLSTGFVDVAQSKVDGLSATGLGPALDGLFYQSNFGIVLRMRVWLAQKPASFRVCMFRIREGRSEEAAVEALRNLQAKGILAPCSFALWNKYKLLASQQQYPWHLANGEVLDKKLLQKTFSRMWKDTSWFGFGALYSSSAAIGRHEERIVRKALAPHVDGIKVFKKSNARLFSALSPLLSRFSAMNLREVLNAVFFRSVYLGNPIRTSLKSVYWRKKIPLPETMHPDRDRCGLHWLCHVVPFTKEAVAECTQIVEQHCFAHDIEPNIALLNVSERALHLFVVLVYDRDVAGADAKAELCQQAISQHLVQVGYSAYRLGIQSMEQYSMLPKHRRAILRQIKGIFDPKGIIAPGRYE